MIDFNVEQLGRFYAHQRNYRHTEQGMLYLQVKLLNQTLVANWPNGIKLTPYRDNRTVGVTLLRFGVSTGGIVGYIEEASRGEVIFMSSAYRPIPLEQEPTLIKEEPVVEQPADKVSEGPAREWGDSLQRHTGSVTYVFPTPQLTFLRHTLFNLTDLLGKARVSLATDIRQFRQLQIGNVYYLEDCDQRERGDPLYIGTQVILIMQSVPWIDQHGVLHDCHVNSEVNGPGLAHSGALFTLGEIVDRLDKSSGDDNQRRPEDELSPVLREVIRELESLRR